MTLHPGDVVGGYTIEDVIGHGGMGTVYRARHPALPRSDALKVLSAELSRDAHFRARFEREAELAASLDHPNIVTIHNRGETDGQLWIAMQYVAGSDADNEIKNHRMTPERAVHIIGEVARALDYAHRRHLLHRDIKPANFLLAPNDERVFLADFGIARALDEAVNLTQTGTVMASIAFASPEALAGEEIDHRSDVYSLGCSLYRMLTGNSPFGGRSGGMAAIAAAHMVEPPPRATDSVPNLPTAFDAVIAQAMAKEPAQRFQTAGELAQAAVRALDETTNAVRVAPAPARGPGWPGDHTPPRWPTQATGSTGPTGPTQATGPTAPTPYGPGPTPPPSGHGPGWSTGPTSPPHVAGHQPIPLKRRRRPLIAAALAAVVLIVAGTSFALWPQDSAPTYTAQTLVHEHGQTTLTEQPRAVVVAGPGDADAVLSLDVQPVAIVAPGGELPSWEKDLITGDVRVLPTADAAAIAGAQPDLILDTGEIDGATYRALSDVATTITRPQDASDWTWQTQLQWTARILGHEQRAKDLIDKAAAAQADLRSQHPVFDGKSIEVVLVTDDGISVASPTSPAARYLQGLGFRYPAKPAITSTDGADMQPVADPEQINLTPTDVRIVLRTDRTAGNGSYNGLPQPFSAYRGATIIVDDPAAITALQSPGYAAVNYLNTGLVNALARQVR